MDNLGITRIESGKEQDVESAIKTIYECGKEISDRFRDEMSLGWFELTVGDTVYFKTYDDINDVISISKGEIIELITSEKKIMNKPGNDMMSRGWHREKTISCKIRWNGMTTIVDSRCVYTNKIDALLTTLASTIDSCLK